MPQISLTNLYDIDARTPSVTVHMPPRRPPPPRHPATHLEAGLKPIIFLIHSSIGFPIPYLEKPAHLCSLLGVAVPPRPFALHPSTIFVHRLTYRLMKIHKKLPQWKPDPKGLNKGFKDSTGWAPSHPPPFPQGSYTIERWPPFHPPPLYTPPSKLLEIISSSIPFPLPPSVAFLPRAPPCRAIAEVQIERSSLSRIHSRVRRIGT